MSILAGLGANLLGNTIGSYFQNEAQKAQATAGANAYRQGSQVASNEMNQAYADQMAQLQNVISLYGPQSAQGQQATNQLMQLQANLPEMGEFSYDKTISDFFDPAREKATQDALKGLQFSYASQGKGLSGAAQKALLGKAQADSINAYGVANQAMQSDKANTYQQFIDRFNSIAQNAQTRLNTLGNVSNMGANATNAQAGVMQNQAGLRGQLGQQRADMALTQADLDAQQAMAGAGGWQSVLGSLATGLGQAGSQFAGYQSTQNQGGYRPLYQTDAYGNKTYYGR